MGYTFNVRSALFLIRPGLVLLTRMIISSLSPGKAVFCALEDHNPKFDTITECEPQWRSLGTDSKTMPAADKQL